jgi:Fuc2NAc and GlcNAc transferase
MDGNLAVLIGLYAAGFLLTTIGTWLLIGAASKRGVLDIPNSRSSHSRPIPRGGGLSIVIVFLAFLVVIFIAGPLDAVRSTALWLLLGGSAVAVVGFLDDLGDVMPLWRFLVHLGAVLLMVTVMPSLPALPIGTYTLEPGWLTTGLIAIGLVWFINLFNFMDGIDGIAGVQVLCMLGGALLISYVQGDSNWVTMLGFLSACVAGFLVWNWPPAKIFMGDACSGFLGFSLGALAVGSSVNGPLNLWSWAILGSVFLIDATVTLITRMLRGKKWYQPHRSHAYQNLSRRFRSHGKVIVGILAINVIWLVPWSILAVRTPENGLVYCLIAWAPIFLGVVIASAGREELQPSS